MELGHTEYSEDRLTVVPVTAAGMVCQRQHVCLTADWTKSKLVENGFKPHPPWQDALHRYLQEIEF